MKLLLDTHVFLWWCSDDRKLKAAARAAIADPENDVFVSAASAWEIAIKAALGRIKVPEGVEVAVERCGFLQLHIGLDHAERSGELPDHHADPFDRMLLAQALCEGMTVVTHDRSFQAYDVPTLWT